MNSIPKSFDNFRNEIITAREKDGVLSVHVVGSVLTPDFKPDRSDINSLVVVTDINLKLLDFFISLGKKHKNSGIAAPVLMTPEYIASSLDVFPIEFLNFREIHQTVFGDDILAELRINPEHLRLQCEREVKSKLLWLHQGYISALGDRSFLVRSLLDSITGFFPVLRAIIFLGGRDIPLSCHDIVTSLQELIGLDADVFETVFQLKNRDKTPGEDEMADCFARYYEATKRLVEHVDAQA